MIVVALILFYMLASTYFTVLRLAMFKFFHVVPGHTDAGSLIISATLFSRYASPLCVNFLSMLPLVHLVDKRESVFESVMGIHMQTGAAPPPAPNSAGDIKSSSPLPAAAVYFIDIFPVVLGIFCPIVAFGGLSRLKGFFSKSRFSISDEGICDDTTAKGRAILDREKENIRNGGRPGETHSAFTARAREPKKRAGLSGYLSRAKPAAADGDAAGERVEEQRGLLAPERERPPTRSEEIKARLGARLEAIGQPSQAASGRGRAASMFSSAPSAPAPQPRSSAAAPPPSRPSAVATAPLPPAKQSGSSLDDFFAGLGR